MGDEGLMDNTDPWRLFIALPIEVSPSLRVQLQELAALGRSVRPTRPEQIHLTLKFLGDIHVERIPALKTALDEVGPRHHPFAWSIQELAAFPNAQRPRVVWAGVEPKEPIIALAAEIDSLLEPLGVSKESRPYCPHVTLARVEGRPPDDLRLILQSTNAIHFGNQRATALRLYRSILKPSGVSHQRIHEVPLQGHERV